MTGRVAINGSNKGAILCDQALSVSGATGTRAATDSGTQGWRAGLIALKPAGASTPTISGSIALALLTLSSSLTVTDSISGSVALPSLTISDSIIASVRHISGSLSLADLTLSSSLEVTDKISGSLSLQDVTLSSSVKAVDTVSGGLSLSDLTLSSSITTGGPAITGSLGLTDLSLSSALAVTDALSGTLTLPTLSITGTVTTGKTSPAVIPHDDYDGPWWYVRRESSSDRLARMRREIGLLPPTAVKEAAKAVEKAVKVILAKPQAARTEAQAFDLVKAHEKHFRKALRSILGQARAKDAEEAWREQVRQSLIEQENEEVLMLVASWLL